LYRRILGLSLEEATFARRGFHASNQATRHWLEQIGYTFLNGYHAALEENNPCTLVLRLNSIEPKLCGFAFEGAAMALALLDRLTPWHDDRLATFLNGSAAAHIYMIHVGAGWALARLPWRVEQRLARFDPLLRWMVLDGYGFHHGYFAWQRYILAHVYPSYLSAYARRAFDQGLGRSIWFVEGADVIRIPQTIAAFPPVRHADLWSGIGLACAYSGGVDQYLRQNWRRNEKSD
jgi:enediyne biosynthesis protein E3